LIVTTWIRELTLLQKRLAAFRGRGKCRLLKSRMEGLALISISSPIRIFHLQLRIQLINNNPHKLTSGDRRNSTVERGATSGASNWNFCTVPQLFYPKWSTELTMLYLKASYITQIMCYIHCTWYQHNNKTLR